MDHYARQLACHVQLCQHFSNYIGACHISITACHVSCDSVWLNRKELLELFFVYLLFQIEMYILSLLFSVNILVIISTYSHKCKLINGYFPTQMKLSIVKVLSQEWVTNEMNYRCTVIHKLFLVTWYWARFHFWAPYVSCTAPSPTVTNWA